ncbi:hypothetical protein JCM33374_g1254 [Metschnikowia sp. JCM 33374]|nr:hypothetical protein JCM33374_g1254 [Metschnikowia sp. JCM 33374]
MPVLESRTGISSDVASPVAGYGTAITSESHPGNKDVSTADVSNTPSSSNSSTSNTIAESSNCLPLILRSINVQSIPNVFLLNKVPGAWGTVSMASGFDMDVDEEDDDIDHKDSGLFVKAKNMDELLNWLVPNLVFDSGITNLEHHTSLRLPDFFSEEVITDLTDGRASRETAKLFAETFPMSYNVTLDELLMDSSSKSSRSASRPTSDLKGQLPFLDDMAIDMNNDEQMNFASPEKHTSSLYWDSFYPNDVSTPNDYQRSEENGKLGEVTGDKKIDENAVFSFSESKIKACKNKNDIINLNFLGTRFWKYFNFDPVNGPKRFQVLMVTESRPIHDTNSFGNSDDAEFLDLVKYNYADMRLGEMKKLNLQTFETRPDLEGISNGILMVEKDMGDGSYNDFYKRANRKLKNLAELIKLDLINRTNRFEFDRPILLLFVNFDESIKSVLQISKICRNFKVNLNNHQLSLVEVFAHVIPSSYIFKKSSNDRCLRYLSDTKLARISTILYNKCPNINPSDSKSVIRDQDEPRKLYSQLVKDTPASLQFKFFNRQNKESLNNESQDDMFLHVAYKRSVDKNWICAAWSDPLGIVTHMRSWYCPPATKNGFNKDVHDLGSIIFKIWEISNKLFKKLNEDISQRTCGSGKKKFLVLARVSSIIPDDELLYWKRLTAKYKDVSLIVLTTSSAPKYLFESSHKAEISTYMGIDQESSNGFLDPNADAEDFDKKRYKSEGSDFIQSLDTFPVTHTSTSPSGNIPMSTSPMNNALTFHSPQQFPNAPSNMFLSPDGRPDVSFNDADCTLKDTSFDIIGIIPKVALPSCNSPTRYSMRTGYLLKEAEMCKDSAHKKYIVFEVSLLSCSNYWNLDTVMRITLKQFKKLIALNDILGICDRTTGAMDTSTKTREVELQTLVPWHVNAVVKALDYLVHVHVEE